jgi:hypothetical protein
MKLYTEEQVDKMLSRARMHKQDDTEMFTNEYLLSEETPIELPSDEEIKKYIESTPYYGTCTYEFKEGIEDGIKWMKKQILNKNQ